MSKVAVIGGGSFGTVIANITALNGCSVRFWMRSEQLAEEINTSHENSLYLPGYRLSERVVATHLMEAAVADCEFVFVAVPSESFRSVVQQLQTHVSGDTILVSTTKGIEAGSFLLMSQVLAEECPALRIGVLSGPNLAMEIAAGDPTGTVIASPDVQVRESVREVLKSEHFKVYTNNDILGVELGGSLKNIYAIIAGIAAATGLGYNTKSMLVTRSLAEMARFGRRLGADPMTFLGLSGVGDLVVTCATSLSRNFRVGQALGRGKTISQALTELDQVAEGVNTVRQVKIKADELGVYMPLVSGLYKIIYEKESIRSMMSSLMLSERMLDVEFEALAEKSLS